MKNPCETPILKKIFKQAQIIQWNIIEKETVDEIIFRTTFEKPYHAVIHSLYYL